MCTIVEPVEVETERLRIKAETGAPDAQYELGSWYFEIADGSEQCYAEAIKWYRKAAAKGVFQAKERLHEMQGDRVGG
jgi:TPR repeat protein